MNNKKICVPVTKDDEITFQLMAKWWAKEIPWGFKEVE